MKDLLEKIGCVVEEKEIVSGVLWYKVSYQGYIFYLKPVLTKSNKYLNGHRILTYHQDGRIQGWSWRNQKDFEALLKLVLGN